MADLIPVFWLEAQPWDAGAGAAQIVRLCSHDLSAIAMFGNLEWLPLLNGGPVFSTAVYNGNIGGKGDVALGGISLTAASGDLDTVAAFAWQARPVKIWTAMIDASVPTAPVYPIAQTLLFDGIADSYDPDDAVIQLAMVRPNGKIAKNTYAGTGGVEGAIDIKGKVKPFAAGTHRNREAQLVDMTKVLFQVHDGQINALTNVRESGRILDQTKVLHATNAALLAAVVPETEIHYCLATGFFRLGFTPVGDISWDGEGAKGAGAYSATVADLVLTLLGQSDWNLAKIDAASFATVNAAQPQPAQFYDSTGLDIMDGLSQLMGGAGGYWDVDELGILYIGLLGKQAASDFSLGDEGLADHDLLEINYEASRAPFWKNRVGWGQNPMVVTFDDVIIGITTEQTDLIASIQSLVDGTVDVLFAGTMPPVGPIDDLWQDTDDGIWYKSNGTAWVPTTGLGALGSALVTAAGAEALADGKVTTFFQDATPVAFAIGDLWIRPADNPKILRRWSGTAWDGYTVPASLVSGPTNIQIAFKPDGVVADGQLPRDDFWRLESNGVAFTTGMSWTIQVISGNLNGVNGPSALFSMPETGGVGQQTATSLLTDVAEVEIVGTHSTGAKAKLRVKYVRRQGVVTFSQDATPTATGVGDLWTRPSDNPFVTKRWNGTAWVAVSVPAATVLGPSTIEVDYKADGNPDTGQLPRTDYWTLVANGVPYTAGVTWVGRVMSGSVNETVYAGGQFSVPGTGNGSQVVNSLQATSTIEFIGTHTSGATAKITVTYVKNVLPAPTSGGSGGGATPNTSASQSSSFVAFTSTTFIPISNELAIVVGSSSTTASVAVNLEIFRTVAGSASIELKVQRDISGVWTDEGATVTASNNKGSTTDGQEYTEFWNNPAVFLFTRALTGLTSGSSQKVRVVARLTLGTGTQYPSGSLNFS